MEQCRRRSSLNVDKLAEIILPFVSGLKWLNYNETTPTKRVPSLIVPLAPLYVQFRKSWWEPQLVQATTYRRVQ
jgi:hypothetical protein